MRARAIANETGQVGHEVDLLNGLPRGDSAAFEAVYRDHQESVMCMLRCGFAYVAASGERRFLRVSSAFDVEELCQETFTAFFQQCRQGHFDPERPVRPYLRRIAMNLALRQAGKASRELLVDEPRGAGEAAACTDSVEEADTARLVSEFRGSLDPPDQAVVDAYFAEQMSQQAVGAHLGLSRDQVYRRITKVRQKAIRFFKARGWFDET